MIALKLNRQDFSYDIYTLVKAFFPKEEIKTEENAEFGADCMVVEILAETFKIEVCAGEVFPFSVNKEILLKQREENKGEYKKEIKLFLYDFLEEYTKRTLPWGNLTGIRPTKLILGMLKEEAKKNEESIETKTVTTKVKECLYHYHRVGEEKATLGIDIALREEKIMQRLHGTEGYSVYIGIPFCPSTCLYCSFTSNPVFKWKNKMQEYLACIRKELEFTREMMKDKYLDTVYIGGGTPTTLSAKYLDILLEDVTRILPFDHVKEFTVEAGRADSITREKLEVMRRYPVTRISVNPQTMKEETLRIIGRNHTVSQVKEAFTLAREAGFDNINMDMILGLPGERLSDVEHTLSEIAKLSPESLTVHSLAVKRASKLKQWIEIHGGFSTMDYEMAMKASNLGASKMGMEPYYLYRQKNMVGNLENTGYAKPGKYGLYNILIMEEVQSIVALGAGSVSKAVYPDGRIERCDNVKDVALYMSEIDEMIQRKKILFSPLIKEKV